MNGYGWARAGTGFIKGLESGFRIGDEINDIRRERAWKKELEEVPDSPHGGGTAEAAQPEGLALPGAQDWELADGATETTGPNAGLRINPAWQSFMQSQREWESKRPGERNALAGPPKYIGADGRPTDGDTSEMIKTLPHYPGKLEEGAELLKNGSTASGAAAMGGVEADSAMAEQAFNKNLADYNGTVRGALAGYIGAAGNFSPLFNQSAMEQDFGPGQVVAKRAALASLNARTGMNAADIRTTSDGSLAIYFAVPEVDDNGLRVVDANGKARTTMFPQIIPADKVAEILGEAGSGLGFEKVVGAYTSKKDVDMSWDAWKREMGRSGLRGLTYKEARAEYAAWRKDKRAEQIRDEERNGVDAQLRRLKEIMAIDAIYEKKGLIGKEEQVLKEAQGHFATLLNPDATDEDKINSTAWLSAHGYKVSNTGGGGAGNFTGDEEGFAGKFDDNFLAARIKELDEDMQNNPADANGNFTGSKDMRPVKRQRYAALRELLPFISPSEARRLGAEIAGFGGAEGGEAASGAGTDEGDDVAIMGGGKHTPAPANAAANAPAAKQQSVPATAASAAPAKGNANNATATETNDGATPKATGIENEIDKLESKLFGKMETSWEETVRKDHSHEDDVQRVEMAQRTEHSRARKSGLKPKDYSKALAERKAEQSEWLGSDYRYNIGAAHQYQKDAEAAVDRANAAVKYADSIEGDKKASDDDKKKARERASALNAEARSKQEEYLQFLREIDKDFGFHARNERARRSSEVKGGKASGVRNSGAGEARKRGLR